MSPNNIVPSTPSDSITSYLTQNPQIIGSAWIVSSSIFTTYSTTKFLKYHKNPTNIINNNPSLLLPKLDRPVLLTLYRFTTSLLLGLTLHPQFLQHPLHRIQTTITSAFRHFTIPAILLFLANYANSIALDRIGISLTYISKCGIPILTVILTYILGDDLPPIPALWSLLPIAMGIGMASWNEPSFESIGFASALVSCAAQSGLNVWSKRVMKQTGISGLDAQRMTVLVGWVVTISMIVLGAVWDGRRRGGEEGAGASLSPPPSSPPLGLSMFAAVSYHVEYVLSFMFVSLVTPVTYGICDAIRRLSIILSGRKMFGGEPLSVLNISGVGLALLGALFYSLMASSSK